MSSLPGSPCVPQAPADSAPRTRCAQTIRLGALFGTLYFIQGISEPTEGLIAQPVRSLLDGWGLSPGKIGLFSMLLALPWTIKPLFGILTDFVPFWGRRRKSYLILVNAAALGGLLALYFFPPSAGSAWLLLVILLVPTVGVAFGDVVVDALMVERGQPLGITGRLQSIQWACNYGAAMLTGFLGGRLSSTGQADVGFLLCAAGMAPALVMSVFVVREPRCAGGRAPPRAALKLLGQAARTPSVLAVGAFLLLWNFNPFSSAVLQLHMKHGLGFDEQFYGNSVTLQAGASVVASIAYAFYCRRLSRATLLHAAIVLGIVSTIGYWVMYDERSAVVVSLAVGFTYMTATLIQLDLAAQICPAETAGTVFALLMSLTNLGLALGYGAGGWVYECGIDWCGRTASFNVLVGIGAATTAACWCLVPWLRRAAPSMNE